MNAGFEAERDYSTVHLPFYEGAVTGSRAGFFPNHEHSAGQTNAKAPDKALKPIAE